VRDTKKVEKANKDNSDVGSCYFLFARHFGSLVVVVFEINWSGTKEEDESV
jgi:hypothetical protein